MQKIFSYLILSCVLFSCSKNEIPKESTPELSLSTNRINLSGNRLVKDSFTVSYKGRWTASIDPSNSTWCSLSSSGGSGTTKIYVLSAEDNLTNVERNASIVVKSVENPTSSQTINLIQKLYEIAPFDKLLGGSFPDLFEDVLVVSDGFIAVGNTESNNADITLNKGLNDALIVKFDKAGIKLWQKTYGGSSRDYATDLVASKDGGFVISGYSDSQNGDITNNKGTYDAWVIKINSNGNLQWQKNFGGSGTDYAYSISPVPSGGYVIAGRTYSSDGDIIDVPVNRTNDLNSFIVNIDEDGNKIWSKTIYTNHYDFLESVKVQSNGEIVCFGSLQSSTDDPNEPVKSKNSSYDFYVCKLSADGIPLWRKTFGGFGEDLGRQVVLTNDGGIVLCGSTTSINTGDVSGHLGNQDGWMVKLSGNGDFLWQKAVGSIWYDGIYDAVEVGSDIVVGGFTSLETDHTRGWIARISSSGSVITQRLIGIDVNNVFYGISSLGNGMYLGVGYSEKTSSEFSVNGLNRDAWLATIKE